MKRAITVFLAVVMLLTAFPFSAFAAEATYRYGNFVYSYVGNDKVRLVGCVNELAGTVYIPSYIAGLPVLEISEGAFQSRPIKTLAIDGNNLVIGKNAFKNCPIEVLTIYGGVTDIGQGAFSGCPIEKVYIKKGVSTIRSDVFSALADNVKTKIFFSGTKSDWANINVYSSNSVIKNAEFTYNVSFSRSAYVPEAELTLTDSLYPPVTFSVTDCSAIAGYYIGNNEDYYKNEFITTDITSVDWDITIPDTYYFTAADICGNRSKTLSVSFDEIALDGNGVSDVFKRFLIKRGTEFTPPQPEITDSESTGAIFLGWNTDFEAESGEDTFVPVSGETYYAIWQKRDPADRKLTLDQKINGEELVLTLGMKEAKGLMSGELVLQYDKTALLFKEGTYNTTYFSFSFDDDKKDEFDITFALRPDSGLPSNDSELCKLYFDIIKRDGSKCDVTVSGTDSLSQAQSASVKVTLPDVPREFFLEEAVSEETFFLTLSTEKAKYLTEGTLSLQYDTSVFTLSEIRCNVGVWQVEMGEAVNNTVPVTFAHVGSKQLTDEKYEICMFIFRINDRNAGEQTIKISGTGSLASAQGDSVTVNLQYTPELPEYTLGDVNSDGSITASDARLALRASVSLEKLSETQTLAADVDKNKKITASDARMILRTSVGLENLS